MTPKDRFLFWTLTAMIFATISIPIMIFISFLAWLARVIMAPYQGAMAEAARALSDIEAARQKKEDSE